MLCVVWIEINFFVITTYCDRCKIKHCPSLNLKKEKIYMGFQFLALSRHCANFKTNFKCTLDHIMIFFCKKISNYLFVEVQEISFIKFWCFIYEHFMSYCKNAPPWRKKGSPVHKRPPTKKTHHIFKNNSATGQITCDIWHVTCHKCYLTCYMILHVLPWHTGPVPASY